MCTAKQDLDAAVSMMHIHLSKLKIAIENQDYSNAATAINALAYESKHATGLVAKVNVALRAAHDNRPRFTERGQQ